MFARLPAHYFHGSQQTALQKDIRANGVRPYTRFVDIYPFHVSQGFLFLLTL